MSRTKPQYKPTRAPRASAVCTAEEAAAIRYPAEPETAGKLREALATMPIAEADRTTLIAAAIVLDHDADALAALVAQVPAAFIEAQECLAARAERFEGLAELCRATSARLVVALSRYELAHAGNGQ